MTNKLKIIKAQALIQKSLDERWYLLQRGTTHYTDTTCALCDYYLEEGSFGCNKCPIGIDTKQEQCHGSPYYMALDEAVSKERGHPYEQDAIDDMVKYLEDLIFRVEDIYMGE